MSAQAKQLYNVVEKASQRTYIKDIFGSTEKHLGPDTTEMGDSLLGIHFKNSYIGGHYQTIMAEAIDVHLFCDDTATQSEKVIETLLASLVKVEKLSNVLANTKSAGISISSDPNRSLPRQRYAKFIERPEIEYLRDRLLTDDSHVVVCGPPGIGKRALVHNVLKGLLDSREQSERRFNRLAWIDFSEEPTTQSLEEVLRLIARSFGVKGFADGDIDILEQELLSLTSDSDPVVILHGYDQLLDSDVERWAFRGYSGWKFVLITTDGDRAIRGIGREEIVVTVGQLSKVASQQLVKNLMDLTSHPFGQNQNLILSIVDQVDGHPLLLRSAVEFTRNYPDKPFTINSLDAVWNNSCRLLSSLEHALIACLAWSPGGLTPLHFERLAPDDIRSTGAALNHLHRLGFADLVSSSEGQLTVRYHLVNSAKEYILNKMASLEMQPLTDVKLRWLNLMATSSTELRFNWRLAADFSEIELSGDIRNYLFSLKIAEELGEVQTAMKLAKNLVYFAYTRGDLLSQSSSPVEIWLRLAELGDNPHEVFEALVCKLNLASKYGKEIGAREAQRDLMGALKKYGQDSFPLDLRHWHTHALALFAARFGSRKKARQQWRTLLSDTTLAPNRRSAAQRWLASSYLEDGHFAEAQKLYEAELELARRESFARPEISALIGLANIAIATGDAAKSPTTLREAIRQLEECNKRVGDGYYEAEILTLRAHLNEILLGEENVDDLRRVAEKKFFEMGYEHKSKI